MRQWGKAALPGLAGMLGLMLAAEWLAGPAPVAIRQPLAPPASTPQAAMDDEISQWANTVLARPLFNESRRPDDSGAAQGTGMARLSAIIISGGSRSAIFAADGQKPQIVPEGGEIDGYKLTHISADAVELTGPSGALTLHPQFPAAAQPAPPAAAPPATPSAVDYDNES